MSNQDAFDTYVAPDSDPEAVAMAERAASVEPDAFLAAVECDRQHIIEQQAILAALGVDAEACGYGEGNLPEETDVFVARVAERAQFLVNHGRTLGPVDEDMGALRASHALLRRLSAAALTVLADRERRCKACGKPATYKRKGCMLVGAPNAWCDEHYAIDSRTWRCHPSLIAERDEYQFPGVVELRAALEAAGALTLAAAATATTPDHPWNWCEHCAQHVDADDVHDGSEVRCVGCERWYVCTSFTDGSWQLLPADPGDGTEGEDSDNG